MKHHQLYTLSIVYFLMFVVALFATGVALFLVELVVEDMADLTQQAGLIKPKSMEGLIEILSPHIIGMGLMLFVVAHFLLFSKKFSQVFSLKVFVALALVILTDQISYLFISMGWEMFGWVKLFMLFVYASLLSVLVWMVASSL